VTGAQEATLDVELRDGDFSFEGQLSDSSGHRVDCEQGDVTLRLPADTALYLDAHTRRGRIDNELPVEAQEPGEPDADGPDEEHLVGALNDGKTRLRIEVQDGDILLETR
jgi:hypothetical protein